LVLSGGLEGEAVMSSPKTHFPQIPIEKVQRIIELFRLRPSEKIRAIRRKKSTVGTLKAGVIKAAEAES
jgi:hypothetical protein